MSIESFLLTDQWKTPVVGDHNDTDNALLRQGIVGSATVTAIIPPGVRVEDDPRAWSMLSRPMQGEYHIGRLIGPDGHDGIRLIGWVNGHPITYRIERRLRYAGQRMPNLPTITVAPIDGTLHLPDAVPVDPADFEDFEEITVSIRRALEQVTDDRTATEAAALNAATAETNAGKSEGAAAEAVRDAREHAEAAEVSRRDTSDLRDETEQFRDEAQSLVDLIPDLELTLDYSDLQNVPEVFTPAAHTHLSVDITDAQCCAVGGVIIRRDEDGRFTVVEPTEDAHPVSRAWARHEIDTAMESATGMTAEQIQMIQELAAQISENEGGIGVITSQLALKLDKASAVYSRDAGASVPRRNEAGQLAVPSVPAEDEHATSRAYVNQHVSLVDGQTRTWVTPQIDALTTIIDQQGAQIVALQGALASLRGGHDALAEVAVQSLTVNRLEQVDQAPAVEDALEDEIYFVRRGDRV